MPPLNRSSFTLGASRELFGHHGGGLLEMAERQCTKNMVLLAGKLCDGVCVDHLTLGLADRIDVSALRKAGRGALRGESGRAPWAI